MTDLASFTFLPWVREGYRPEQPDQLKSAVSDASELDVAVRVAGRADDGDGSAKRELVLRLYGPGDVLGFDRRQVVRMEPEPATTDFTPNYFPTVEFDRPDLPWLFSPASADGQGRVRPWFTLVVVEKQEGVSLGADETAPLPVLEIDAPADPARELPDLSESWAWAHAQVVGRQVDDQADVEWARAELQGDSTKTVSRLVAPRRLDPDASYYACVVPTFEPGRRAGLGKEPFEQSSGEDGERDVEMAWTLGDDAPSSLRLPVYHSWQFSTGEAGDFESLVRELEPETLTDVGYREVDASDPGVASLAADGALDVRLEGALRAVGLDRDPYPGEWRSKLASLLEGDLLAGGGSVDDSTLGPPAYGIHHAAQPDLGASSVDGTVPWLYELNADPRNRVAAGFGSAIVREDQEHLMGSAWEQVGEIRRANRLLRRAQLARAGNNAVFDVLGDAPADDLLVATAPAHDRLLWSDGDGSLASHLGDTRLPASVLSPALRRMVRPRGPLADRLPEGARVSATTLLDAANDPSYSVRSDGPPDGAADAGADEGDRDWFVDEICSRVGARAADAREERAATALPEGPAEYLDELHDACAEGSQLVREAVGALESGYDEADRALEALVYHCDRICGEIEIGFEESLLSAVQQSIEEEDDEAFAEAVGGVGGHLAEARDAVETLLGLHPSRREDVSTELLEAIAEHCGRFEEFYRRLVLSRVVMLLRHECRSARSHLETVASQVDGERAVDAARTLLGVCAAVCDEEAENTLLERLERYLAERDYDAASDVVAELNRLLAVAKPRLATLVRVADDPAPAAQADCETFGRYVDDLAAFFDDLPSDPVAEHLSGVVCDRPEPTVAPPADVSEAGLGDPLRASLDPEVTVPRRVEARLSGLPERDDPLDVVMAAPEFDRPMYARLADQSQEHLLPGVGSVSPESVGLVETNPAFVESFMVGLSHEMARELRWREYPTDMRGTYFHRFWDRRGGVPKRTGDDLHDVEEIHEWPVRGETDHPAALGSNHRVADAASGGEADAATSKVVLLVRSELLRRYPNTTIYAAAAQDDDGDGVRKPDLPTPETSTGQSAGQKESVTFPTFRGELDPDVTFLGFDLTPAEARGSGTGDDLGWFFVFEEAPGEPRLGLDTLSEGADGDPGAWEDLTWQHLVPEESAWESSPYVAVSWDGDGSRPLQETEKPVGTAGEGTATWGTNSAHMASITWQPPVRIGIHADDMLPPAESDGGEQ